MPTKSKLMIACALLLTGCAATSVPPQTAPRLTVDPEILEPTPPVFLCLTERWLYGSPQERTKLLEDLRAVRQPWTLACEPHP